MFLRMSSLLSSPRSLHCHHPFHLLFFAFFLNRFRFLSQLVFALEITFQNFSINRANAIMQPNV